jgi:hypothetical protein
MCLLDPEICGGVVGRADDVATFSRTRYAPK